MHLNLKRYQLKIYCFTYDVIWELRGNHIVESYSRYIKDKDKES